MKDAVTQDLAANASAPSAPRFLVGGLRPGTSYLAFVISVNAKGRSEPAILHASTLRQPEMKQSTLDTGTYVYTLGACKQGMSYNPPHY